MMLSASPAGAPPHTEIQGLVLRASERLLDDLEDHAEELRLQADVATQVPRDTLHYREAQAPPTCPARDLREEVRLGIRADDDAPPPIMSLLDDKCETFRAEGGKML